MTDDSEEKILEDWNRIFTPSPWVEIGAGIRMRFPTDDLKDEKYRPVTDIRIVYRELKEYARRHGRKGVLPSKETNSAQEINFRKQMGENHKEIMSLWIRAKKLRKNKLTFRKN